MSLNDTVSNLYDSITYDSIFSDLVFFSNDYTFLFFGFTLIPMVILFFFYRPIDPIPVKLWKWIIAVILSFIIVYGFSFYWLTLSSNSMYTPYENKEIGQYISAVKFIHSLCLNSVLFSIVPTILFSWIFSRTISINNAKNPF